MDRDLQEQVGVWLRSLVEGETKAFPPKERGRFSRVLDDVAGFAA